MADKTTEKKGSGAFPPPHIAEDVMACALEHYVKHHRVVLTKLEHAQTATHQSLDEIKELQKKFEMGPDDMPEFKRIRGYDQMWQEIIGMFRISGISEEELDRIEKILHAIPNAIRRYYLALVEQDKLLQELITDIRSEKYQRALRITKNVQLQKNPMTGLGPEEYDLKKPGRGHFNIEDIEAFMIKDGERIRI